MKCEHCGRFAVEPIELTPALEETLLLLCKGFSQQQIANRLGVTRDMINEQRKRLYLLLGASSRAEVAVTAARMGFPV